MRDSVISAWGYVLVMILVHFVAIDTGISVLWYYFNRYIPFTYTIDGMTPQANLIRNTFKDVFGINSTISISDGL